MDYKEKYLKYKSKYVALKNQLGNGFSKFDYMDEGMERHLKPNYFLAFEKDNKGLFDEKNDNYYVSLKTDIDGPIMEYRSFKRPLNLVVTDEKGNKSTKLVNVEDLIKSKNLVLVKLSE